jgi:hypothetical protein
MGAEGVSNGVSMTARAGLPSALTGTLLAYANHDWYDAAVSETARHSRSGLVLAEEEAVPILRRLKAGGYTRALVFDPRLWARQVVSVRAPMVMPESGGLFQVTLDEWAAGIVADGATAVFTPSKFVQAADWPALDAVVRAGNAASRPELITLIAADAAMLDDVHRVKFIDSVKHSSRATAFLFAAARKPLATWGRAAGLRDLVSALPGCLLLGTEVLAATDVLAHGAGAAAIGLTGGLRRPNRPGDQGGGNNAVGGVPGLFLRDLWEQRSPSMYADWYAGRPSPHCSTCGRVLDSFGSTRSEKKVVLRHNVHAWLEVFSDIGHLRPPERRRWLVGERLDAFMRHASLRPAQSEVEADPLLRQLVELDDPMQRRTTPAGTWR